MEAHRRVVAALLCALTTALLALGTQASGAAAAASITIESSPPAWTGNATPTFSGSTEDVLDPVTLDIYEGASAEGVPVQSPTTLLPPALGSWSLAASSPLADGAYTAVAEQNGAEATRSEAVHFDVDTRAPTVTLKALAALINDPTPTFEGAAGTEAGDSALVMLEIYAGSSVKGSPVRSVAVAPSGGSWSGAPAEGLPDGTYTAIAEQSDEAGNTGHSATTTFTIDTASPTVTLDQPPTPSNHTKPTFSGSASDTTTVVVHIFDAALSEVATATATPSAGHWSTSNEPSLSSGEYTAIATQESSLGNAPGESNEVAFAIDTSSPHVTLAQPPSPSNDTRPSFTGTASESTQVTVHVYDHLGNEVTTATAEGTGAAWSSGKTNQSLSNGEYTAIATQESSLGNPPGESNRVSFTVNTNPPTVTLHQPVSPSNDRTPSFSGFASDKTPVTVRIYGGSRAEGSVLAEASAEGDEGEWVSANASPPLESGTYTAVAVQASSLGNAPGVSEPVTFVIDTGPPHVTLNTVETPSNDTTPSFTGTASDHTPVTIEIHAGASVEGPLVSEAAATGGGGAYTSGPASPALQSGEYTAIASQESSLLGNPTGVSAPITFVVDTSSPTVTLQQPPTPSNNPKPTFSGSASDTTKVAVHIFNAAQTEVASTSATPSSGHWSTSGESSLASGSYTALATQESSLGNPPGESNRVSFTVNTNPPSVTLNSPPLRSNDRSPAFTGTASDSTQVTVHVYEGSKAEGKEVASATATPSAGTWSSPSVSPPLASGVHTYTAVATQPSSLGNPTGVSNSVTFVVDTSAPSVTLAQPQTPTNHTTPSFSGTASDTTPVTIRIYLGTEAKGTEVSKATASGTGGAWSSGAASPPLATGTHTYTAVARQESSLSGNPAGESAPVTFTVDTTAPKVTLNALAASPSNDTTPSFSGTASDHTTVSVRVYLGEKAEGTPVSTATASANGGAWSSSTTAPALPAGFHEFTAVATQESSIGNPPGTSAPISFIVDTTSPVVTITSPANGSASNVTSPTFAGTASGTDASSEINIHIYEGAPSEGRQVSAAKAKASGGKWTSSAASPALATGNHHYTAVATDASLVGNAPGSAEVTFTVDTLPPTVTLRSPPSPSNTRTPSFEGTASDTTTVQVKVYEGKKAEGTVVASASASPSAGAWTSGPASPPLPARKHEYTAIAIEESSLGNPSGKSAPVTFIVDPEAPTVTLNQPAALSNDPTPTFSGTAADTTPVTVRIYAGTETSKEVAHASATGTGGAWSSASATPALGDGQYTAIAEQSTVVGEHVGRSAPVTFTIDTVAPPVTLRSPTSGAEMTGESVSVNGTASTETDDLQQVTVQLFDGPAIEEGHGPAQSITVNARSGEWSTTLGGLAPGTYTVRAQQRDEAGNVGVSAASTFTLASGDARPGPAATHPGPNASFLWVPSAPRAGQPVSLVSNSSDLTSPIVGFAWDLTGTGTFSPAGSSMTTTFATSGNHVVQLRVTDASGLASTTSRTIPVGPPLLLPMQPFPIVRINSIVTRTGVRLTLLGVLAPTGSRITVRCKGHSCPLAGQSHLAPAHKARVRLVQFNRFERSLRAGVTLEVRVAKAGMLGKYTRFVVRHGRAPLRLDACLAGVSPKPVGCGS